MIQQITRSIALKLSSGYLYVFLTIFFSTYVQIVLRWQMVKYQSFPLGLFSKLIFVFTILLTNIYLFSVLIAGGLSFIFWLMAVKSLPLNIVYPMISLCFVTVTVCSCLFFKERMTVNQVLGISLIIVGSFLINK